MPYLSRLSLNAQSWAARRDMGNDYQLHSTLSRAVASLQSAAPVALGQESPSTDRERLLFRLDPVDGQPTVLVQSLRQPDWSFLEAADWHGYLTKKPDVKILSLELQVGQVLRFRLRANPTRKTTRAGRKVRESLLSLHAQLEWLQRKLTEAGADLLDARAIQEGLCQSRKHAADRKGPMQTLFAVRFEGVLRVTDPASLLKGVEAGFGSAKGYGFGLLSLAPV